LVNLNFFYLGIAVMSPKNRLGSTAKIPKLLRQHALHLAIVTILSPAISNASPIGAQVINGQVTIDQSVAGTTTITNTPNAIINWQDFNIATNETTRFIQENSQSAVLNRIVGGNPSEILGQLFSNGKVFLINPNGMVFGAGSVIDTQGLIASSLNLSDNDFQKGNFHFIAGSSAGDIVNEGVIHAGKDGNIVLIAPTIENHGALQSDGGSITLAAGQELILTSLDNPEIRFQIQAPKDSVLNIGQLLTEGGAINVFAGTIKHSGDMNADSVEIDQQGNIQLVASHNITLEKDSRLSANNSVGDGGNVTVIADGKTEFYGDIQAKGGASGKGGFAEVSGKEQLVFDGKVNLSSPHGKSGKLLLDPKNIIVESAGTVSATGQTFVANPSSNSSITPLSITNILDTGTALTLQANNDITVNDDVIVDNPTANANGGAFTLQAGRSIAVNAEISTDGGNLTLVADETVANGVISANRDSGAAAITLTNATINSGILKMTAPQVTLQDSMLKSSGTTNINGTTTGISLTTTTLETTGGTSDINLLGSSIVFNDATINSANNVLLNVNSGISSVTSPSLIEATNTMTIATTANSTVDGAALVLRGDKLRLLSQTPTAFNLNSAGNSFKTVAANINGSLNYKNNAGLTIGSVSSSENGVNSPTTTNGINTSGAVSVATHTGNLTVAQSVTTADSSSTALILNANSNATTQTTGNILISGSPTISVGSGGVGKLFTGSVTNSTGLTNVAGLTSGSERFRYNSDESVTNYSKPLETGLNAIYREQPVISVSANPLTKTYDGSAYTGGNGVTNTGFVNGDTSAILTGLTYGGASQGATNVGTHTITPSAVNGLGYGMNFVDSSLTINPIVSPTPPVPPAQNKLTPILSELIKGTPEEIDEIEDEIENGIKAGTTTVLTMSAMQSTKRSDDTPTLPAIQVTKESKSKNDDKDDDKDKKGTSNKNILLVATSTDTKTTKPLGQCK
jgi:filamentous hemagglutinin family protein